MVDSSESADWNEVRNTLRWESLPRGGVAWRDGTANNREPMISRTCAGRPLDVYRLEKKAQEPAVAAPAAGVASAPAPAAPVPEFELEPLLVDHGYAPFPEAYWPTWKDVKEVRKVVSRTKVLIP